MERLKTKKECAGILNVCTKTVDRQIKQGMPHLRIGGQIRFDMDEVLKWIKEENKCH